MDFFLPFLRRRVPEPFDQVKEFRLHTVARFSPHVDRDFVVSTRAFAHCFDCSAVFFIRKWVVQAGVCFPFLDVLEVFVVDVVGRACQLRHVRSCLFWCEVTFSTVIKRAKPDAQVP